MTRLKNDVQFSLVPGISRRVTRLALWLLVLLLSPMLAAQCLAQDAAEEAADEAEEAAGEAAPPRAEKKKPTREWPDTKIGKLMHELQDLQNSRQSGQLEWERKMQQLILLGPDAVPELIAALDATPIDDRLMLRSIPFLLRGIGDKRAIPALIRAIPRCYGNDGSDMGYRCDDPELMKFMQEHDNSDRKGNHYSYGRPVNEVYRTLERWTGVANGWNRLAFVSDREGTPRQRQLKQKLFQTNATRWAGWWNEHWRDHVEDAKWSKVDLPDFEYDMPLIHELDRDKPLKRVSGRGNMIAQSVYDVKSGRTFFDLDTGQWSGLPQRFRKLSREELNTAKAKIVAWAKKEGFDLMGTEVDHGGQSIYALEAINLKAWEIPMSNWKSGETRSPQSWIDKGRPIEKLIAHYDTDKSAYDHEKTGLFFYITSEDTAGQLYLGIEVKDTNLTPGLPSRGDSQLNPKGFWKGRRFGLSILGEPKE